MYNVYSLKILTFSRQTTEGVHMFFKTFKMLLMVLFTTMLPGCALGIAIGITEGAANALSGTVEVGDVKMKPSVNVTVLKTTKLSSAVFEKDMATQNLSPDQNDIKVNKVVTEEVKRLLSFTGDTTSLTTARLKTFYYDSMIATWYYRSITERETLTFMQKEGVRKLVNTHFLIEQGGGTLLEVRGLWVAGSQGDEIAGARQLAREVANAVLKKLNSPASSATMAEEKK